MTVGVETDRAGTITDAPPIVRKFVGQHIDCLRGWLRKQPGYREAVNGIEITNAS